jgi:hypothetical protein
LVVVQVVVPFSNSHDVPTFAKAGFALNAITTVMTAATVIIKTMRLITPSPSLGILLGSRVE